MKKKIAIIMCAILCFSSLAFSGCSNAISEEDRILLNNAYTKAEEFVENQETANNELLDKLDELTSEMSKLDELIQEVAKLKEEKKLSQDEIKNQLLTQLIDNVMKSGTENYIITKKYGTIDSKNYPLREDSFGHVYLKELKTIKHFDSRNNHFVVKTYDANGLTLIENKYDLTTGDVISNTNINDENYLGYELETFIDVITNTDNISNEVYGVKNLENGNVEYSINAIYADSYYLTVCVVFNEIGQLVNYEIKQQPRLSNGYMFNSCSIDYSVEDFNIEDFIEE